MLPLHLKPGTASGTWAGSRASTRARPRYERVYGCGTYASTAYRSWLWDRVRPMLEARGFAVAGHRGPAGVEPSGRAPRTAGGRPAACAPRRQPALGAVSGCSAS
ncbi:hypothetical protein IU11_04235 [Cellulosimicrobium sp. MM]|nr:hypothetical protein IU11_04235 [Cellulosimicrobium sp. MM]